MIGYLTGTIKFKEANKLIVEVNNVGYQVQVPLFVLQESILGQRKAFFVHTYHHDDGLDLYGFFSTEDKEIFLHLISVGGIGPKSALNIVSYANGAKNIVRAIRKADVEFFSSIKGIGKKSAQRIIVDLKGKIGGLKDLEFETDVDRDLIEALKGLGFSQEEIRKGVKSIKKDLPLEEKIRLVLRRG